MPAASYEVASLPKAEPRKIAVRGWTRFIPAIAICLVLVRSRIRGVGWPLPLYDFMTYWAAGKLFISGANPYSASAMYALERALGWQYTQPLVLLNPPWTLPFIAPLGALSFNTAHYLWWALSMFVEAASAIALWRYFGGESRKQWIALIIAVTFLPSGAAEHMGQITPLMLGALTIFLLLMRRRREVIAGVFLIGLGLKPHLLYLVMLAVILWTIESRRWKLAIAAISSYAAATLGAIVFNHQVLKYAHGTTQAALDTSCGVGGALRSLFGTQLVWLQFLPTLAGVAWFAFYWSRHRIAWRWEERIPVLLLMSIATAPYSWAHDYVLVLPAFISLGVALSKTQTDWLLASAGYLVVQMLIFNQSPGLPKEWVASLSLLWLVFYAVAEHFSTAMQANVCTNVASANAQAS